MDWKDRIIVDPELLGGRPAVRGTRLAVSLILELMAAGSSEQSILAGYPRLCQEDVRACLRYAAESLEPQPVSEIDRWIQGVDDDDGDTA